MAGRVPDWPAILSDYIRASHGAPFSWGERDCALWAANGVRLLTGVDLAAPFRGHYHDQDSAIRVLHAYAGGGLEAAAAKACAEQGWPEIEPAAACSGDLGIVPGDGGPSLALCFGWQWTAQGHEGLVEIPDLTLGRRAWRVAR